MSPRRRNNSNTWSFPGPRSSPVNLVALMDFPGGKSSSPGRMNRLTVSGAKVRRLVTRQVVLAGLAICVVWLLAVQYRGDAAPVQQWTDTPTDTDPAAPVLQDLRPQPRRMPTHNLLPELAKRRACHGPRGRILGQSPDDDLGETELDGPYWQPWAGSFEELGLDLTMMTVDQRYGPYGFGEDRPDYNRERVDWDKIDWGQLQNDCFQNNRDRFPEMARALDDTRKGSRFGFRNVSKFPEIRHWHEFEATRRTAIVLRSWRGYKYMPEDLHYMRSLIAETSLRSGGEYQVILLVDMKDYDGYEPNIFASEEAYQQGLKDAGVPPEFESITLLWDNRLLQSWYPKVEEYRTMWQVFQPLQLLALHYPEFDHFWQLEMDMRFLGDTGKFLDKLTLFARNEPRKQALERSSFWHMIAETGDYGEHSLAVDKANKGGSHAWGPVRVPEILPIGPDPPVRDPVNETFQWGVGEEADALVTSYCMNANIPNGWPFKHWVKNLASGTETFRFYCPPAISRASRTLLLAIHQAQLEDGIAVPSEATLPTFALWHGLKLSFPQHPVFNRERDNHEMRGKWWRGGPRASSTGLCPDSSSHPRGNGLTFWWESDWSRHIFSHWTGQAQGDTPWILHKQDGKLFMPNIMLHPVKHLT